MTSVKHPFNDLGSISMDMIKIFAFAGALTASVQVLAEPAGKVLAVAGSATIERDGQAVTIQAGQPVESGDVLAVGAGSALQVRFTDESVVALRANSRFKIENYQFKKDADTDRSLFGLLKGGMRTVTGLIGKFNQRNYAVQTSTSTIGIRGTHFTLVACNDDCIRPDGTPEANGTYGGVTDGRIHVANQSGAMEFGQQESFFVANANLPPVRLLVPPALLNDRGAAARGRSKGSAGAQDTATAGEADGSSGTRISTSPQLTDQSAPLTSLNAPLTQFSASDLQSAKAGNTSITVLEYRGHVTSVGDFTEVNFQNFTPADIRQAADEVSGASFYNSQTLAAAFRTLRPVGSSAAAGVYWMYEPVPGGFPNNQFSVSNVGSHHIWGDTPQVAMPTAGLAQYNYVGGTPPSDTLGRTGVFTGSHLLMDFGAQKIKTLSAMSMDFAGDALPGGAIRYTVPADVVWPIAGGPHALAGVSCVTGCASTSSTTGQVNGRFVGTDFQGYAAAFKVFTTQREAGGPHAAGNVAGFARQ
jgi:hypothetical protein